MKLERIESMRELDFWLKRFSVGLALNTTIQDLNTLLDIYHYYIDNIYMSLPLGDQFHGRSVVIQQFKQKENIQLFWNMVDSIIKHNIKVEVVFNTENLNENDFIKARNMLDEHNVVVDKIAILNEYYEYASNYFPKSKVVYSVNNIPNTIQELALIPHKYDEIVVGRQQTRNDKLFCFIQNDLQSKCVLLLNNGCSHTCGGCSTIAHCRNAYEQDLKKYSPEYIYALNSIFPVELHCGYIKVDDISLFKISTRNADTCYIEKCLDSYISNRCEEYIVENSGNYMLWSRLKWHAAHFDSFNFEKIIKIKKVICER